MRRLVFAAVFAAAACAAAAAQAPVKPAHAAGTNGSVVRAEIVWGGLDQNTWQMFMFMGALKQRMGGKLDLTITPLAAKKDGKWFSPRGESDIADSKRLAVVARHFPGQVWDYMNAKLFSYGPGTWAEAAAYAGINPEKLEALYAREGENALEAAYKSVTGRKITSTALLIAGSRYDGEYSLVSLFGEFNRRLPAAERFYEAKAAKQAATLPVKVWVVVSSGAVSAPEDKEFSASLNRALSGMKVNFATVLYENARKIPGLKELKMDFLPLYAVETSTAVETAFQSALERGMARKSGGYIVFDHGAGEGVFIGRDRKPGQLDLYVMSMCPYGVLAERTIMDAMEKNLLPQGTTVQVHYILDAEKDKDGVVQFSSMHGSAEWEENLRQLIIARDYPDKFWKYLAERNKDYHSSLWDKAASAAGIDPQRIITAFDSARPLLEAEAALAKEMNINGSPTFVWEGRSVIGGAEALKKTPGFEKIQPVSAANAGSCGK
ncbi:MAG: hypothetical protein WC421_07835 [Elusimicrobiales bacterium]